MRSYFKILFICCLTWVSARDQLIFYQQNLYKFCQELSDKMKENENLNIELRTDDMSRVFEAINQSTADGFFIKRKLTDEEKKNYPDLEEIPIMTDALIFINRGDLGIDNLTINQLFDCYFRQVTWSDVLGKDYSAIENSQIKAYMNASGSGDVQVFLEKMNAVILDESPARILLKAELKDQSISKNFVDLISSDQKKIKRITGFGENIITYVSLNPGLFLLNKEKDKITVIAIDGVEPSTENIKKGLYPFSYDCHLVVNKDRKNEQLNQFIGLLNSPVFIDLVKSFYYVPK